MSNLTTVGDILADALQKSGELQTNASPYYSLGLTYLNNAYREIVTGSSTFIPDMSEVFQWAQAQNPLTFVLKAPYVTDGVSLTNGLTAGTFDTPPAYSVTGYFLTLTGRPETYRIVSHTAGAAGFVIDTPYADTTIASSSFKAHKLDYVLDIPLVIDGTNNSLDFKEGVGSELTAVITSGTYALLSDLCVAVATALNAAGGQTYSVSASGKTVTISAPTTVFSLLTTSGTHAAVSAFATLGFSGADVTGLKTYSGTELKYGIARLFEPFRVDRAQTIEGDNEGMIYGVDPISFSRQFPRFALTSGVPTHFTIVGESPDGEFTMRVNKSPNTDTRVEFEYVPIPVDLAVTDVPLVPRRDRMFLSYATAYWIMFDKSDPRADAYFRLAQAKLQAMAAGLRKQFAELGSKNYGRLIARGEQMRTVLLRSASGLRF